MIVIFNGTTNIAEVRTSANNTVQGNIKNVAIEYSEDGKRMFLVNVDNTEDVVADLPYPETTLITVY